MPAPVVRQILDALNRDVLNQLELAKSVSHPAESGRAREQIIAAYLRRIVPRDFGIDTGFVIDAQGGISRQVDLVVYRPSYHPVFDIGGVKHFMIEAVAAVIENKASIASRKVLRTALENIQSVKALDRSNGGQNYVLSGSREICVVDRDNFQHQVFGAIVTERSLTKKALMGEWKTFLKLNPNRREWPNFYADVRNFSGLYMKSTEPAAMTVVPAEAVYLALTEAGDADAPAPLLELTFELINLLRGSALVDFSPREHLFKEGGRAQWCQLPS